MAFIALVSVKKQQYRPSIGLNIEFIGQISGVSGKYRVYRANIGCIG
jgi:hypothetical protein